MREKVKTLKHKADLRANMGDGSLAILHQSSIHLAIAYHLTFNVNAPAIDLLQVINAAQQCRLAGTAGSNNHYYLPAFYRKINAIQDRQVAKAFDDLLSTYHLDAICLLDTHLYCSPYRPLTRVPPPVREPKPNMRSAQLFFSARSYFDMRFGSKRFSILFCTKPHRVVRSR